MNEYPWNVALHGRSKTARSCFIKLWSLRFIKVSACVQDYISNRPVLMVPEIVSVLKCMQDSTSCKFILDAND